MPFSSRSPRRLRHLAAASLLACSSLAPLHAAPTPPAASADTGARLFSGQTRFVHGGAACISCHSADGGGLPDAGGHLAVDLGHAWIDIGPAGIQAMIATPPFAPMAAAYDDHPPTAAETQALLAFLQRSAQHPQAPGLLQRQGSMLLGAGAGALLVLLLLQAAWRRRKTLSTKHAIYARQSRRG